MTTATLDVKRPRFQWDRKTGALTVRASAAGECHRKAYFELIAEPASDPSPDANPLNLRAGRDLEPLVFQALRQQNWRTSHYANRKSQRKPAFVIELSPGIYYTGEPDGRIRWSGPGENPWMLVETKTRSARAWTHVSRAGNLRSNPEAVSQLAVYQAGMGLTYPDEIDVTAPAVIATLNSDTKELNVDVHLAEDLTEHLQRLVIPRHQKIRRSLLGEGNLPEADLPLNHWKCQRCPFRTRCGNVSPPAEPDAASLQLLDEKLVAHWQINQENTAQGAAHRSMEKQRRNRQEEIINILLELGQEQRSFVVDKRSIRAELSASESRRVPAANLNLLSQWLTPEQFDRITEPTVTRKLTFKTEGK